MKTVLHVGCGHDTLDGLEAFRGWSEVRLDIDEAVGPDLVASITELDTLPGGGFDAVYSCHNLEHLDSWEVPRALAGFRHVLRPGGLAVVRVPDLQIVGAHLADGNIDRPIYTSPAGPIRPLDMLFGLQWAVERGNDFMRHRTGFTAQSIEAALIAAGFEAVVVTRTGLELIAEATTP